MKRSRGEVVLILPTEDVLSGYKTSEYLLSRLEISLKDLADSIVDQWIQSELRWGHFHQHVPVCYYDVLFDSIHGQAYMDCHEPVQSSLSLNERRKMDHVVKHFSAELYLMVCPLLESFKLSDHQLRGLQTGWVGSDMVVKIPVY